MGFGVVIIFDTIARLYHEASPERTFMRRFLEIALELSGIIRDQQRML